MKNSEIIDFQFKPTKGVENWEVLSSADSELRVFRRNEPSVDNLDHHVFQLLSNTNSKRVVVLTWVKHVRILNLNT